MTDTKRTCEERVFSGGGFHGYVCRKPAKVEKNGKHYCGIHNPDRLQAIRDKNNEKWRKESDKRVSEYREAEAKKDELNRRYALHDDLVHTLSVMTNLCRLKYGNLDKEVYAEIERAEALLAAS